MSFDIKQNKKIILCILIGVISSCISLYALIGVENYCFDELINTMFLIGVPILLFIVLITIIIKGITGLRDTEIINKSNTKNHLIVKIVCVLIAIIVYVIMIIVYNSRGIVDDKPIIYLYPETEQEVSVKVGAKERLTCTYPKYNNGWNVLAKPNGDLVDVATGRNLYALYWEGKDINAKVEKDGFVVKGEDSIKFLEEKLEILGLNEREAEEFIVYWLPKLEANKYNYIRFETKEEIDENMPLIINPMPDTVIRIVMNFKGLNKPIKVEEQKLNTPERKGFTVVEWGGTEIK